MWLFTVYGFFSVVCDSPNSEVVMVRARKEAHLRNLQERFPKECGVVPIEKWKNRDYPCRIIIHKSNWSSVLVQMNEEQTWTNFKSEVHSRQGTSAYETVLHQVWQLMFNFGRSK